MCIYLPQWPLQNLWHRRPELRDKPVALIEQRGGSALVTFCCPLAAGAGVRPGMARAEAVAIQRHLLLCEEDPAKDRQALERLAEWAERYSPIVSLEEAAVPQSLLLDITGCAACFHGEDRLAQQAARELRGRGWDARVAVASTLGAAWGVAHVSGEWRVASGEQNAEQDALPAFRLVPSAETEQALGPLPLSALRLPEGAVATLAALGIERIGQLVSLPRSGVPGRFGADVLRRLDQAMGHLPEVIVPHQPVREIQASCSFAQPTDRIDVVRHAADRLLERIEATLRSRNRGARKLECWLYHEALTPEAPPVCIEVGLFRPSGSARHLSKLLGARLERVRIAEPIVRLCLRVPSVEFMVQRQFELFDADASQLEELGDLIDRLASQFGSEAVTFARLVEDCQPEYACRFEPAIAKSANSKNPGKHKSITPPVAAEAVIEGHRPLLVWPVPLPIHVVAVLPSGEPRQFVWLGREYTVSQCWGPERIETGWWRGHDVQRDYYTVATDVGTRLWLFRRHQDNHWFLHGCFD